MNLEFILWSLITGLQRLASPAAQSMSKEYISLEVGLFEICLEQKY